MHTYNMLNTFWSIDMLILCVHAFLATYSLRRILLTCTQFIHIKHQHVPWYLLFQSKDMIFNFSTHLSFAQLSCPNLICPLYRTKELLDDTLNWFPVYLCFMHVKETDGSFEKSRVSQLDSSVSTFLSLNIVMNSAENQIMYMHTILFHSIYFFFQYFKFPISFTICHLVIKFVLAALVRKLIECKRKEPRVMLSWPMYLKRLAPTGNYFSILEHDL